LVYIPIERKNRKTKKRTGKRTRRRRMRRKTLCELEWFKDLHRKIYVVLSVEGIQ